MSATPVALRTVSSRIFGTPSRGTSMSPPSPLMKIICLSAVMVIFEPLKYRAPSTTAALNAVAGKPYRSPLIGYSDASYSSSGDFACRWTVLPICLSSMIWRALALNLLTISGAVPSMLIAAIARPILLSVISAIGVTFLVVALPVGPARTRAPSPCCGWHVLTASNPHPDRRVLPQRLGNKAGQRDAKRRGDSLSRLPRVAVLRWGGQGAPERHGNRLSTRHKGYVVGQM